MKRHRILTFIAFLLIGLTYNLTLGVPADRREDRREDWRDDRRDDWRDDRRDDRIERRIKNRVVRRILRRHVFTLPPHHTVMVINGFNYYFWDGVYYLPFGSQDGLNCPIYVLHQDYQTHRIIGAPPL